MGSEITLAITRFAGHCPSLCAAASRPGKSCGETGGETGVSVAGDSAGKDVCVYPGLLARTSGMIATIENMLCAKDFGFTNLLSIVNFPF
jgi:hypothetical protein